MPGDPIKADVATLLDHRLQIAKSVGLASTAAAIYDLMVDRLECHGDARIDERVAQLLSLTRLGPLRDQVEGAVNIRKAARARHRARESSRQPGIH